MTELRYHESGGSRMADHVVSSRFVGTSYERSGKCIKLSDYEREKFQTSMFTKTETPLYMTSYNQRYFFLWVFGYFILLTNSQDCSSPEDKSSLLSKRRVCIVSDDGKSQNKHQ